MANDRKRRRSAARRTSPLHALRIVHDGGPAEPVRRVRAAHFDHDESPRVTPARGASAHGSFQIYESCDDVTQAGFLCDVAARTPAFVQFSSVLAARRGADTVRDVRSFAVKLFTADGNFDLVGQSSPVLHIDDGVRFPDTFHARAPDPVDAPFEPESASLAPVQAALWSYACAAPRTASSLLWLLSQAAQPRSLRMMAGYGVHTYRLVDGRGQAHLARFVWRPLLGVHALADDEAALLADEDPDFHRRDLWDAIEDGDFPEWELCLQLVDIDKARALDIDLLDATEAVSERSFPLRAVGKLTLTRNPSSFLKGVPAGTSAAQTPAATAAVCASSAEQDELDFHPSHTVPGIDFTDDPTLQRLLGNAPQALAFLEGTAGPVTRRRVAALDLAGRAMAQRDPLGPARRMLASMTNAERTQLVRRVAMETAELPRDVRVRARALLQNIDPLLLSELQVLDATPAPTPARAEGIRTRRIAVLVADGVSRAHVECVSALQQRGAHVDLVAHTRGTVSCADGATLVVDHSHRTASSLFYDAVCVPGGRDAVDALRGQADAIRFVEEAFQHGKPIGVLGEAQAFVADTALPVNGSAETDVVGVVYASGTSADELAQFADEFTGAIQQHRFFERPPLRETNE